MVIPVIVAGARIVGSKVAKNLGKKAVSKTAQKGEKYLENKIVGDGVKKIDPEKSAKQDSGQNSKPETQRGGEPFVTGTQLEKGASDMIANGREGSVSDLLNNPTTIRRKAKSSVVYEQSETEAEENEARVLEDELSADKNAATNASLQALDDLATLESQQSKIENISKILKEKGIHLKVNDIEQIIKSRFKVKFPWVLFILFCFQIFASITLPLVSTFFLAVGFSLQALPVIGTLLGGGTGALGLTLNTVSMVISAILSVITASARIYYTRTASEVLKKINFVKRYMLRYVISSAIIIFFGLIPFLNIIVSFLVVLSIYFMAINETRKVKRIIESNL
jgi:hypothetical protein